jgi:hypothetical protein
MFTYLIGREISDLEAAKWMACNNKGYFTHVTTLAEVKEQVSTRTLLPVSTFPYLRRENKQCGLSCTQDVYQFMASSRCTVKKG